MNTLIRKIRPPGFAFGQSLALQSLGHIAHARSWRKIVKAETERETEDQIFPGRSAPTEAQQLPPALFPLPVRNNLPHVSTLVTLMDTYRGVPSRSINEHMPKVTFKDPTPLPFLSHLALVSLSPGRLSRARCLDILSLWSQGTGADIFVEHRPRWKLCNLDSINNEAGGGGSKHSFSTYVTRQRYSIYTHVRLHA